MKLSSQEEYGLRCLLRLARRPSGVLTIPEISDAEGISGHYVAKLMRILRRGGFVTSARGQTGGYTLSRAPEQIILAEALAALGGRIFDPGFCSEHSGTEQMCNNTVDCSIRTLWSTVQQVVDQVLSKTTLADLLPSEQETSVRVDNLVKISSAERQAAQERIRQSC
jgi:Rrf2 family protein